MRCPRRESEATSLQASYHRLSVTPQDGLRQSTDSDALRPEQEFALRRRRRCSSVVSPRRPPQGESGGSGLFLGEVGCSDRSEGYRGNERVNDDDDDDDDMDAMTIELGIDIGVDEDVEDDTPSLLLERELARRKRRRRAVNDITATALFLSASSSVDRTTALQPSTR